MDMKREYYEDIQFLRNNVERIWFFILIAGLIAFPFLFTRQIYLANLIGINILVAIGLNFLVGYTGQISLGHAGFFAIGAYTTVLLMLRLHLPFWVALPLGGLVAALFGFLLGLPSLRLEGPYLAIATLGFGMAIIQIIGHWEGLFGGRMGLMTPKIFLWPFSIRIRKDVHFYFVILIVTLAMSIGARNLCKTKVGRAFVAIRDSDIAAATMGVNLTYYKTLAFAISAFYTGIAGGLMACVMGFISPASFNLILSITFLAMVVVGGLGSILGSILGAVLLTFLELKLSGLQDLPILGSAFVFVSKSWFSFSGLPNVRYIIYGLIMVLIVIFEPLGLYGLWIRTKIYWKKWPF
jgi:branched-chain amino acid transport system permease protein